MRYSERGGDGGGGNGSDGALGVNGAFAVVNVTRAVDKLLMMLWWLWLSQQFPLMWRERRPTTNPSGNGGRIRSQITGKLGLRSVLSLNGSGFMGFLVESGRSRNRSTNSSCLDVVAEIRWNPKRSPPATSRHQPRTMSSGGSGKSTGAAGAVAPQSAPSSSSSKSKSKSSSALSSSSSSSLSSSNKVSSLDMLPLWEYQWYQVEAWVRSTQTLFPKGAYNRHSWGGGRGCRYRPTIQP